MSCCRGLTIELHKWLSSGERGTVAMPFVLVDSTEVCE